jgi:hypothetical protein
MRIVRIAALAVAASLAVPHTVAAAVASDPPPTE